MKLHLLPTLLASTLVITGCSRVAETDEAADRAAIHQLLMEYGSTLDDHNFDAFSALFAEGSLYNGESGPEAGDRMRVIFAANRLGLPDPKFHVFFNEVTTLDGADSAHSTSMSYYVAPGEDNLPKPVMMARYTDELVREGGQWKFKNRGVEMLMPAPAQAE